MASPPPYFNLLKPPTTTKVTNNQVSKTGFFSVTNPKAVPQPPISITGNSSLVNNFKQFSNISTTPTSLSDSQDYNTRKTALGTESWTYKVSLVGNLQGNAYTYLFSGNKIGYSNISSNQDLVTFEVTPTLTESGSVNLMNISDLRSIASFIFWTGTASRMFSISAKLISRTQEEADSNYQKLFKLKSWRMPVSEPSIGKGTTPEVLMLFAYGQNINGVPVAVQSLSVDYSDESDQILTSSNNPIPIILPVRIELVEVRNRQDFRSFNYDQFRQGILPRW